MVDDKEGERWKAEDAALKLGALEDFRWGVVSYDERQRVMLMKQGGVNGDENSSIIHLNPQAATSQ